MQSHDQADQKMRRHETPLNWLLLIGVILCMKIALWAGDRLPMLFLGDSEAYLDTAVNGIVTIDRSFLYGFVIRWIAVPFRSLDALVALQVAASTLTVFLATFLIRRFYRVRSTVVFALGIVCALDPLQLLYERYVMTETIALFALSLYFLSLFFYLEKPSLLGMLLAQFLGTLLISLRLSYLPLVGFNTLALPMLATPHFRRDISAAHLPIGRRWTRWMPKTAVHLLASLLLMQAFHATYRHLNGYLTLRHPGYQYCTGLFLLADWAPNVKADDFPCPYLAGKVLNRLQYDLSNREVRWAHRWAAGGLVPVLHEIIPDLREAEDTARQIALNSLRRNPLGILRLAIRGYRDYWNVPTLRHYMGIDRGDRMVSPPMLAAIQQKFGQDVSDHHLQTTLTNTLYFAAWPWYLALLCTPLFALVGLICCRPGQRKYGVIVLATAVLLVSTASSLIERPTIRYLHPLGWLMVLSLAPVLERLPFRPSRLPPGSRTQAPPETRAS